MVVALEHPMPDDIMNIQVVAKLSKYGELTE
jgi:hypothetical protein